MRLLPNTGLVEISPAEWEEVKKTLLEAGYLWRRDRRNNSKRSLYTPDGGRCVSDWDQGEGRGNSSFFLDADCLQDCLGVGNASEEYQKWLMERPYVFVERPTRSEEFED